MDLYHCQIVEGDLAMKVRQYLPTGNVGHFRIAGVHGRARCGRSELHLPVQTCWTAWARRLDRLRPTRGEPPATGWLASPGSEETSVFPARHGHRFDAHEVTRWRASKSQRWQTMGVAAPVNPWARTASAAPTRLLGCPLRGRRDSRTGLHGPQTRRGLQQGRMVHMA